MTTRSTRVITILGAGPGLGMSMAHRFGREGFAVALVSRSSARHEDYRASLAAAGVTVRAYAADVTDETQLAGVLTRIGEDLGEIDTVYFGLADAGGDLKVVPVAELDPGAVRGTVDAALLPAVAVGSAASGPMLARGRGAIFFAGGLSGKYPIPALGSLVPASAALRMYALTLHAGLKERGVYVASLTIGGLIERGDLHRMVTEHAASTGTPAPGTLDPDEIADTAWKMYVERELPEAEFSAISALAG